MEILSLVFANPWLLGGTVCIVILAVFIFVGAAIQGREVSFWPPKIGAKPMPLPVKGDDIDDIDKDPNGAFVPRSSLKSIDSGCQISAIDQKKETREIGTSITEFEDISCAIHHVGKLIQSEAKKNNKIEVKNYALDLALTVPWAISNFFNNKEIENVTYKALVIDRHSTLIKDYVGNKGTIQIDSAITAIQKLTKFTEKEKNRLTTRNIVIEVRAYAMPPVIHGFMINGSDLYLSFTEIDNGKIETGNTPYLYVIRGPEKNNRYFSVYDSWFDFIWSTSRTVFNFNDGKTTSSY